MVDVVGGRRLSWFKELTTSEASVLLMGIDRRVETDKILYVFDVSRLSQSEREYGEFCFGVDIPERVTGYVAILSGYSQCFLPSPLPA